MLLLGWLILYFFRIPCTSSSRRHVHGAEISVASDRLVAQVLSLQEEVNLAEVGSARVVALPALAHQIVNFRGTIYGTRQQNLWMAENGRKTL